MTSRPIQPGQRPQVSRSLTGNGMLRQAQERSHLNNQLGTPWSSRHNVVDLTNENGPSLVTPGRPGAPMRVSSGLRHGTLQEVKDRAASLEAKTAPTTSFPLPPPPWPRGKPRYMFTYQSSDSAQEGATNQSPRFAGSAASPQSRMAPIPLPFPARPSRQDPPARDRSLELANAVPNHKKEKVPKPYVLETPALAPTCPSKFDLDFFPWTGGHPEDKFSTPIIRDGYADKLIGSFDKEANNGKSSIAPNLKQANSLKMLSHVFTNVLDQRRKNALIISTPTFKPPPRVTLTDTKKENWLKDLADPSIPLRRLSRTIPHGIKNRILLEQCMDKEVPMERAVWLVKCVGANEIRASKRTKAAAGAVMSGGEAKWVRDWTVCVEQFMESAITLFGEAAHKVDGKEKFIYCIRLSSYLFSEQLLDSAHYLEYILSALEGSDTRKLPARIFVAGVHSDDLLRYRRTGRRFVTALCSRLHAMHESGDSDVFQPVIDQIGRIVKSIILSHPESFLSSDTWPQHRAMIEDAINYLGSEATERLSMIVERHGRLRRDLHGKLSSQNSRREVIRLLDSTYTKLFSPELGKDCWKAMEPRTGLAQLLLEWATSKHRPGSTKIFVAARLLRIWRRHGLDVNQAALDFLGFTSQSTTISKDGLYHLYSELTKSGHFSVSGYAHWLIARGGLRSEEDVAVDGPAATRLLAELSQHAVSESALRLRKTLLRRAAFSTEEEQATTEYIWRMIKAGLPTLTSEYELCTDTFSERDIAQAMSALSRTIKAELGVRLRNLVKDAVSGTKDAMKTSKTISIDDFVLVRSILEHSEDISMLADVLKLVSTGTTTSPNILASCADTINVHRGSLAAIGAFNDLLQTLVSRYRTLSMAHGSDLTSLLTSLCELAANTPEVNDLYIEFSKEITRSTRKATVEACSPVSDHVVEVLSRGEASCSDEIAKLLDSGSSMDHTTFVRLYEVLISQIEALWLKHATGAHRYYELLGRLRSFDPKLFSSKLTTWLDDVIQRAERPSISHIFGPLISSNCVGFGEVLKRCSALLHIQQGNYDAITRHIAFETVILILGLGAERSKMGDIDRYKLNSKRIYAQSAYNSTVLEIIRYIIETEAPSAEGQSEFAALCGEIGFVGFLQQLVIIDFDVVTNSLFVPLAKSHDTQILARLRILLRKLLNLSTNPVLAADLNPANRITTIIGIASDLTLPFCQLALRSVFAGEKPDKMVMGMDSANATSSIQAFEDAINQALAIDNTTWTSLIPMLDVQIARHLFESAERQLVLQLAGNGGEEKARQKLFIVEATAYSTRGHRNPSMVFFLMERLGDMVKQVTSVGDRAQHIKSLPLVLEVIRILTADLFGVKQAGEIRSGFLMLLAILHLFLRSERLGTEELRQMVFDTILGLADELDEQARIRCIKQIIGQGTMELGVSTPNTSIATPAIYSGNFNTATTPSGASGAGMSPAQATFQITTQPQLATGILATLGMDPELCYALSFGRDKKGGLVILQKGGTQMMPFQFKRWEALSEPTPLMGENDTSLNMRLFQARKN